MLYAVDSTIVAPKLPGVQWVYAGTDWTWYEPIRAGDTFTVEAVLTKAAGEIRAAVQALGAANRRSAIPEPAWPLSRDGRGPTAPARPAAPIMRKMTKPKNDAPIAEPQRYTQEELAGHRKPGPERTPARRRTAVLG